MAEADPQYWKLVALMQRIHTTQERLHAAKLALMAEHGLDPAKEYTFNDAEETITETPRG